jgi:protein-disulfide isomerase
MTLKNKWSAFEAIVNALTVIAAVSILFALTVVARLAIVDRHLEPSDASSKEPRVQQAVPAGAVSDVQNVVVQPSPSRDGPGSARVAMIEFSDFQCPFCGRYARDVYPGLRRAYVDTGRVSYLFRHFPLNNIHRFASDAAQASECARNQNAFWPMHDMLFAHQSHFESVNLMRYAADLRLKSRVFKECLAGEPVQSIHNDTAEASRLGVRSTPTFFLGFVRVDGDVEIVRRISGAQSIDVFMRTIDDIVTKSGV